MKSRDAFWLNLFTPEERLKETLARLKAYQEAGADGIFVPGLTDLGSISEIATTIPLPLNLLAGEWIQDLTQLKLLGVSRLTIGSAAICDVADHVQQRTQQLIKGKFFNPGISYGNFQELFSPIEEH